MKIIRNLSIKTKLLTGFIVIALLIGVTGLFGKYGMLIIENNAEQIYSDNLQSINEIHSIKENFLSEVGIVNDAALEQESSKIATDLQKN